MSYKQSSSLSSCDLVFAGLGRVLLRNRSLKAELIKNK